MLHQKKSKWFGSEWSLTLWKGSNIELELLALNWHFTNLQKCYVEMQLLMLIGISTSFALQPTALKMARKDLNLPLQNGWIKGHTYAQWSRKGKTSWNGKHKKMFKTHNIICGTPVGICHLTCKKIKFFPFFYRYRQVDPAKLNTLKDLINAPNYKDNLATLIRTIYEFAFLTYAGK